MIYCSFQILYHTDAINVLHFANYYSGHVLERDLDERLLYSYHPSLYFHIEYDMVSELCGSSFRQQTLRQVSIN